MKAYIAWCLILILLFGMCGCTNSTSYSDPVTLFYPRLEYTVGKEDSVITSELRESEGLTLEEWMASYLAGPESAELVNPFPAGTKLVSIEHYGETVYVTLTDHFASLSGIKLTLACTCLTRTLAQETNAVKVSIRAENELINGSDAIIMDTAAAYVDYGAENSETTEP